MDLAKLLPMNLLLVEFKFAWILQVVANEFVVGMNKFAWIFAKLLPINLLLLVCNNTCVEGTCEKSKTNIGEI